MTTGNAVENNGAGEPQDGAGEYIILGADVPDENVPLYVWTKAARGKDRRLVDDEEGLWRYRGDPVGTLRSSAGKLRKGSLNPDGKEVGTIDLRKRINRELRKYRKVGGKQVQQADIVAMRIVERMMKGNVAFLKEWWDREEPKPKTVTNDGGGDSARLIRVPAGGYCDVGNADNAKAGGFDVGDADA